MCEVSVIQSTKGDIAFRQIPPSRCRQYFRKGKVFRTLWAEPARPTQGIDEGERADKRAVNLHQISHGQKVASKITWFIVIETRKGHCLCVSIHTYGGLGVTKPGIDASDHTALVCDGRDTVTLPDEDLTKQPIHIIIENPEIRVHSMSRINLAKVYTIEYYLSVNTIGRIRTKDCRLLDSYVDQAAFGGRGDLIREKSDSENTAKGIRKDANSSMIGEIVQERTEKAVSIIGAKQEVDQEPQSIAAATTNSGSCTVRQKQNDAALSHSSNANNGATSTNNLRGSNGWIWDLNRQQYYYWNEEEGSWIYQDGFKIVSSS